MSNLTFKKGCHTVDIEVEHYHDNTSYITKFHRPVITPKSNDIHIQLGREMLAMHEAIECLPSIMDGTEIIVIESMWPVCIVRTK